MEAKFEHRRSVTAGQVSTEAGFRTRSLLQKGVAMRFKHALILTVLATPLAACGDASSNVSETKPVRTIVVQPKAIEDERRAVGEVRPRYESDLAFRVPGKMIARFVDVGATVKKGDLLAQLDNQDYRNKLKQAEADVATAEAVLVETQGAEDRYHQLLEKGYTTRALYDSALKNLRSAEARLNQAKAALNMANDQVDYSELRAEFDGVVTAVGAEPGQVVNTGMLIVRLARSNEKDAVFAVAESAFQNGNPGNERPEITGSAVTEQSQHLRGRDCARNFTDRRSRNAHLSR